MTPLPKHTETNKFLVSPCLTSSFAIGKKIGKSPSMNSSRGLANISTKLNQNSNDLKDKSKNSTFLFSLGKNKKETTSKHDLLKAFGKKTITPIIEEKTENNKQDALKVLEDKKTKNNIITPIIEEKSEIKSECKFSSKMSFEEGNIDEDVPIRSIPISRKKIKNNFQILESQDISKFVKIDFQENELEIKPAIKPSYAINNKIKELKINEDFFKKINEDDDKK